ncbi:MAG: hypothetical protein M0018_06875 [Nitrospiraceae bacterium]|nr:hypothetical protein [Nitrospiraceae bacterium]
MLPIIPDYWPGAFAAPGAFVAAGALLGTAGAAGACSDGGAGFLQPAKPASANASISAMIMGTRCFISPSFLDFHLFCYERNLHTPELFFRGHVFNSEISRKRVKVNKTGRLYAESYLLAAW